MNTIYQEDNLLKGSRFNNDSFYVVFPCSAGDTWYAASFIHEYIRIHSVTKKLCCIVKKSHEDIIRWFITSEDDIIISDELVKELDIFTLKNSIWELDNYLYAHFKKEPSLQLFPEYYENTGNMIDKYRSLVFHLPKGCKMAKPAFPALSEAISERYQIDKKTIILMPYAKSMYPLPAIFWEALAGILGRHGYRLFTNTGPGEAPVKGTEAMAESIGNTILLCQKALAVISLRSGICDILTATDVFMFVIYTIKHYYDFWNLSFLRNDSTIADLMCTDINNPGEIARTIAECFLYSNSSQQNDATCYDPQPASPLISIIMPVWKNEIYFPAAVHTILDQKFSNWELIIMEGISDDRTAEIADEFALRDPRIRVIHTGEWIYEKVNMGIYAANGRYFMVVNSDDKLAPNALMKISDYLLKYDVDMFLIACGSIVCDKNQNELSNDFELVKSRLPEELLILDSNELKDNWVHILGSGLLNNQINVYKLDCVSEHRFRNDVFGADYLYNLDILPKIRSAAYIPECLYYFHVYTDVTGFNTSVGKFYDYTHTMFNDFYFTGLNMFANNDRLNKAALYYLKKRRYMEFINSELPMYSFKSCRLSLDTILNRIFTDTADLKVLINESSITADLDDKVLSTCKELINQRTEETIATMHPLATGINELFRIGQVEIKDINAELIKQMVYDYHNPAHIGQQLYEDLAKVLDDCSGSIRPYLTNSEEIS